MAETLAGKSDLPRAKLPVPQLAEEGYFAKVVSGAWQAMPADPEGVTAAGAAAADEIGNATGATTQAKLKTVIGAASETNDGIAELATAAEIVTGTDAARITSVANLKTSLASDGMWLTKRTKMPDGATAVYSQDAWATTNGWSKYSGLTPTAPGNGTLVATLDAGVTQGSIQNSSYITSTVAGKYLAIRAKISTGTAILSIGINGTVSSMNLTTSYQVFVVPYEYVSATYLSIRISSATAAAACTIGWIWIGDYSYLTGTLSEEAARISNQLGDSAGVGTKAYSTLTSTGTAPADGDTVTIGGKAYTFKTTLGTTEGQVLIGDTASAAAALDNLKLAINGDAGTFGVNHYCAAANPIVTATTNTDTTQVVEATAAGLLGNQITTAESSTQLSWANPDGGTGYLSRGTNDATQKILTSAANYIAGGGTRPAAAKVELTQTSLIGYETTADVASGATLTLPSGGTWIWNVYGYGATISSAKRGSSAGGTTLTVAGANASVGYRRYA